MRGALHSFPSALLPLCHNKILPPSSLIYTRSPAISPGERPLSMGNESIIDWRLKARGVFLLNYLPLSRVVVESQVLGSALVWLSSLLSSPALPLILLQGQFNSFHLTLFTINRRFFRVFLSVQCITDSWKRRISRPSTPQSLRAIGVRIRSHFICSHLLCVGL